jgi:hypothetical protein
MEGRWQLQSCRLTGDNITTNRGNKNKTDKRQRWRRGRAGRCEAEVPLEAMWELVGASMRPTGGGVALVM